MDTALKQSIKTALVALGDTPEQVADSLRQRGMTGMRMFPNHCPIANYLKAAVPDSVGQVAGILAWGVFEDANDCAEPVVEAPAAVNQFIQMFDHHKSFDDLYRAVHIS